MNSVEEKVASGNYRAAAEEIVGKMRNIAEQTGIHETASELDVILGKLFDLPNINWKKAEEENILEIGKFIK